MVFAIFRPERRYARRLARAARWDRPIAGRWQRFCAWTNMLLIDHGLFRLIFLNSHPVTDDLWRSAQPSPHQVADFAARGIRTIVNLRGGREFGSWPLEREACDRAGITLVDFVARSREAPGIDTVLAAQKLFDSIEYPALIHCKSGADRAGFVSALYLMLKHGQPASLALEQLSAGYGHWRWSKTGILDAFIERYRDQGEARGLSLIDWVTTEYDPDELTRSFRPHAFSAFIVDRILRRE